MTTTAPRPPRVDAHRLDEALTSLARAVGRLDRGQHTACRNLIDSAHYVADYDPTVQAALAAVLAVVDTIGGTGGRPAGPSW